MFADRQSLPARHDGAESRPHRHRRLGHWPPGHLWLYGLLGHEIRLCRFPRKSLHRTEGPQLRCEHDASVSVVHCDRHVQRRQTATLPDADA